MEIAGVILFELNSLPFLVLIDVISLKVLEQFLNFPLIFIVDHDRLLLFLLLFVGFNLDASFGDKWLQRDLLGDFDHLGSIGFHGDVEHSCVDVGACLDELNMDLVVEI